MVHQEKDHWSPDDVPLAPIEALARDQNGAATGLRCRSSLAADDGCRRLGLTVHLFRTREPSF